MAYVNVQKRSVDWPSTVSVNLLSDKLMYWSALLLYRKYANLLACLVSPVFLYTFIRTIVTETTHSVSVSDWNGRRLQCVVVARAHIILQTSTTTVASRKASIHVALDGRSGAGAGQQNLVFHTLTSTSTWLANCAEIMQFFRCADLFHHQSRTVLCGCVNVFVFSTSTHK